MLSKTDCKVLWEESEDEQDMSNWLYSFKSSANIESFTDEFIKSDKSLTLGLPTYFCDVDY